MSCMWKNTDPSKNTVCGSVNKAPVAPVAVFHIRVQSVHKHLQMTSPSLSTAPLVHAVTHFIVLANSSSRRWLFAKVTSGKHKKPSKKGWQDRKCGMILRQLLFLSGALSVNEKMLMSGVCAWSCGSLRISHPSAFEPEQSLTRERMWDFSSARVFIKMNQKRLDGEKPDNNILKSCVSWKIHEVMWRSHQCRSTLGDLNFAVSHIC